MGSVSGGWTGRIHNQRPLRASSGSLGILLDNDEEKLAPRKSHYQALGFLPKLTSATKAAKEGHL